MGCLVVVKTTRQIYKEQLKSKEYSIMVGPLGIQPD